MDLPHLGSLALPGAVALLLIAWIIAGLRARGGKPAGWDAIILAGIAPPLLLTCVMLAAGPRFGDLRVALEGVRFRLGELGSGFQVRVGGASEEDHLVVRDLPPGFLTFELDGEQVKVEVVPDTSRTVEQGGEPARKRFAVVRVNGQRPFHNAVPLDEPAQVIAAGTRLAFDPGQPAFGPEGEGFPEIPRRTTNVWKVKVPVLRQLRAEQAAHPLRYYGSSDPEKELLGATGEPLGSFIARDGRNPGVNPLTWLNLPEVLRRRLYLVLTEESVRVERPGAEPVGFQRQVTNIPDGESASFALFRVDYEKPLFEKEEQAAAEKEEEVKKEAEKDEEEPPPSRAQERRSFSARFENGTLDLLFDSPAFVQLGIAELESLKRRAARADVPPLLRLVSHRFLDTAGEGQMLLEYPVLGEPLATELFSRIELPEDGRLRVTTHTGARSYQLGDAFEIGGSGAALVRISSLGLPWGTLVLAWAMAAIAIVGGRSWRQRFIPFVLISGVELLLALRVLIAYEGAFIDPQAASAAWQSLGALMAVPFVLQASLAVYEGRWRTWETLAHGLVVAAALVAILVRSHAEPQDAGLALAAALAMPLLLGLLLRWLDGRQLDTPVDPVRPFRPVLKAAVILIVVRLGTLMALGWKERIDFVAILAVSVYFTPMALWVFGRLWARRQEPRAFVFLWGLLLVLYPLTSWLARDLGALLIFPIPVMILFALPLVDDLRWRNAALAIPLAALFLLFVVLPWVPALGLSPRLTGLAPADVEVARSDKGTAEKLLASRTRTDQNKLRFWNLIAPTELSQVGTRQAEGLVIVMANLRDYAGRGALGTGYLGMPLSEALSATHLDDNLSAVHVLGAFGWLGGLSILLLLCAWALAPPLVLTGGAGSLTSWITPRIAFGLMLVWTLAAAGLYMFSANVELLLFTGKNVYFLASASRSDLVEGTLLVLLALWALNGSPLRRAHP